MNVIEYSLVFSWAGLAAVVLGLALYRRFVAREEDFNLHVPLPESSLLSHQESVARRLGRIDFWGELLTILVVLYGLALAGAHVYQTWQNTAIPR